MGFTALIHRDNMRNREVSSAVSLQWLDVVDGLLGQSSQHIVDVLMEERNAYLCIVDDIVCVLLPHAKAQIARSNRDVTGVDPVPRTSG